VPGLGQLLVRSRPVPLSLVPPSHPPCLPTHPPGLQETEILQIAGANDLPIARRWALATGQELVSEPSVRWAASVLLSRAFSLDMREAEPLEGAWAPGRPPGGRWPVVMARLAAAWRPSPTPWAPAAPAWGSCCAERALGVQPSSMLKLVPHQAPSPAGDVPLVAGESREWASAQLCRAPGLQEVLLRRASCCCRRPELLWELAVGAERRAGAGALGRHAAALQRGGWVAAAAGGRGPFARPVGGLPLAAGPHPTCVPQLVEVAQGCSAAPPAAARRHAKAGRLPPAHTLPVWPLPYSPPQPLGMPLPRSSLPPAPPCSYLPPAALHPPPAHPRPAPPGPCARAPAGSESCLRYNMDLGSAVLSAHRVYQAGEQVFDSYGPNLSPGDLLLDYGFVDSGNSNHRWAAAARFAGAEQPCGARCVPAAGRSLPWTTRCGSGCKGQPGQRQLAREPQKARLELNGRLLRRAAGLTRQQSRSSRLAHPATARCWGRWRRCRARAPSCPWGRRAPTRRP
jgi:hypothetical protein